MPPEKVSELYLDATVLVLPSRAEGMPNVSLESHLSGLPAIVSRQANRDEIIADGDTGFVVPTGRPRPLAEAIARMIALPAVERRAMGARGRRRVLDVFPREQALGKMSRLYLQAIAARGVTVPILQSLPHSARPVTSPALPATADRQTRAARVP